MSQNSEPLVLVRQQLMEPKIGADGEEPFKLEEEWVLEGTKSWDDFSSFVFDETGIVVLFDPYHVAAYAFGPQSSKIEYSKIAPLMQPVYASALGVDHIAWKARSEQSQF